MTNGSGTQTQLTPHTMSQLDRFLEVSVATGKRKSWIKVLSKVLSDITGQSSYGNMWEFAPGLLIEEMDTKAPKDSQENLAPDFTTLQLSTNTQILIAWHDRFIDLYSCGYILGASVHS